LGNKRKMEGNGVGFGWILLDCYSMTTTIGIFC